jgi:ribosomal protein S18 acetylase RimI-like enzyme
VTLSIRQTQPDDAPKLPAIEQSAGQIFLSLPDLAWIAGDAVMDAARHLDFAAMGTSWVACDAEGDIVAFLVGEPCQDAVHIWEISVHVQAQGQGVGAALIEKAAVDAADRGLESLTLTTFRDVPWNEPYYKRLGFETLEQDTIDARLAGLLDAEVAHGFPAERRCAMRRMLALAPRAV